MLVTTQHSAKNRTTGLSDRVKRKEPENMIHGCQSSRRQNWLSVGAAIGLISGAFSAWGSVVDDFRFETSDFMRETAYRQADRLAANIDPSGALSPVNIQWNKTHTGPWYVEEQRYGADAVCGGIADQNTATIERGLKVLHWGFEQQQSDGSFSCPDAFHSTSFLVEAAAHACLILNASQYAKQYADEVNWLKPRILKAANWMTVPAVEANGKKHNAPYTHRRYLVGAALGEAGVLCSDESLIAKSQSYIREGIALQDPSGFNPEKGGFDVSYHAVGLFYADRYYDLVADAGIKPPLVNMLKKGYAWLSERIHADGTIDAAGSTRVGVKQEISRNGVPKRLDYSVTYRGLYHWSSISQDTSYAELAKRAFAGEKIYREQLRMSS
ncbi:MAG TPA: hypothetical protein VN939_09435 [Chthoniobacterales bacterium]|jgi:hypothetical protein|nr:hypothetical protein [Chthoniobacterales bacterium]